MCWFVSLNVSYLTRLLIPFRRQNVRHFFFTECDLSWHPKCAVELSKFPCIIHVKPDHDDDDADVYIDFVTVSSSSLHSNLL